jgi:ubiquinone/menaquinone biosynthesis C-methylase UbiE
MLSGDARPEDRMADLLHLECSSRVLHVPCGDGESAVRLAWRLGCRVVGVDPSQQHVEAAAERAREEGVDSLCTFVRGGFGRFELGDGRFDAVICEQPSEGLPDSLETVQELAGLLRLGGRLALTGGRTEDVAASLRSAGLDPGTTELEEARAIMVATKR